MLVFWLRIVLVAVWVCSVSNGATNCVIKFPHSGEWSEEPPHWQPNGCKVRAFNQSSTIKCLKGRTVYVIGSSIARNYAFELAQLLGASDMNRKDQKEKCRHTDYTWGGCVDEIEGVKFKVLYLQYLDGFDYSTRGGFNHTNKESKHHIKSVPVRPVLHSRTRIGVDPALQAHGKQKNVPKPRPVVKDDLLSLPISFNYPHDVVYTSPRQLQKWAAPLDVCCNISAADCLRPFFQGATSKDILILSLGLNYAVNMIDFSAVNYTSWITESVVHFKQAVNTYFPGRVFRGTMSEVRAGLKKDDVDYNKFIWRTEKLISSLLDETNQIDSMAINSRRNGQFNVVPGSSVTGVTGSTDIPAVNSSAPWFTVDQWSINRGRASTYYQDFVHFHGPLTMAFLHNMLSELCDQ